MTPEVRARLADAISGERRDWHEVAVRPDDIAAILATPPSEEATGLPKDYAQMWLDGGGDPTFDQIDGFLYRHFNARARYIDAASDGGRE